MSLHYTITGSALGQVLIAGTGEGLCAILIGDDPAELVAELQRRFPESKQVRTDRALGRLADKVLRCIEIPATRDEIPIELYGTEFQQRVWRALCEIPAGRTASYADIARRIGKPRSARAVARACAANHLAIVVPCHRVVRSDGTLSGYRWGMERKRALLERERAHPV